MITDLSITPLRPKTSSVPLDGRVFKAATLDAELASELEDATIFEAAGCKDSYVVYWYQLSHLENINEVKAKLLKAIYDTPLFRNGFWEPSLIPHILCQSTAKLTEAANFGSSGSGRTRRPRSNPPLRSTCQSTSKQPTTASDSQRRSRVSLRWEPVTRNVPDTDLQETVEGTVIPIAGSEETDVATWLNWIISSFTPPALQSNSSRSCLEGGSRLTRSTSKAHSHLRLWSSQYAAKPVENSHMSVKPDIVLCGQLDGPAGFAWHKVISFLELTSSAFGAQLRRDITRKAYAVFMSQPSRCFVVAVSLARQEFRLHVFDRSGVIHSLGYNLHKFSDLFARLMYTLAFGSLDKLGFDPTFIDPAMSPSILYRPRSALAVQMSWTIYIHKSAYAVLCQLYISHLICGRGTSSWLVRKGKKLYVLKDYWTHKGRKCTEEEILLKIKGLLGVSQLVEAWTVQSEGADETTDWLRPPFLVGNREFETRLHRRLLLTPVGDPLVQFSSLQELVSIFIDIVHGAHYHFLYLVNHSLFFLLVHFVLVTVHNILHHDMSINNILVFACDTRWPAISHDQEERENVIANKKFRRGLLIDFDYAC